MNRLLSVGDLSTQQTGQVAGHASVAESLPRHELANIGIWHKRGFHPTQRTKRTQRKKRKKRNEMTLLLDRPITAASDDGVCRWNAAKLWQTHAIKYEIIEIKFDLHHTLHNKQKRTEIWTIDLFYILNLKNLSSAGKETARFLLAGACDSYVPYVRCVGWKPRFAKCKLIASGSVLTQHSRQPSHD